MKKLLSLILTLSLLVGVITVVVAESAEGNDGFGGVDVTSQTIESENGSMRLLAVGDTHYTCGTDPAVNRPYIEMKDQYGVDHEYRAQSFINGILRENYIDPVDVVFILGDLGNNDKPFQTFTKRYRNELGKTDYATWTDDDWWYWHEYMMKNFYASEYDCIYQYKVRYLDQLTAAGIEYYVLAGNHDAYTFEMWERTFGNPAYDKDGNLVQESHIGFTYNEDGSICSTDYMLTFPEFDAAFAMLDTYAYEETDTENHVPHDRFKYYLTHDNVAYTPISTDERRAANFEAMVEAASGYKHFYICAHHFSGTNVLEDKNVSDNTYLATAGNKYGNLRLMMYGHDQVKSDSNYTTSDTGVKIRSTCVAQWSHSSTSKAYYDKNTGEKVALQYAVTQSPWGYTCVEHNAVEAKYYRIKVDMTYYCDELLRDYIQGIHTNTVGLPFATPYEEEYTDDYGIYEEYMLYSAEKGE